ncbi:MAG: hypothetical protein JSU96_11660 [Acidobacteriota bacterium]|nr:MAG: hypothetical protein JSU96_11660 [Acidobacteriota bacterium]
MISSREPSEAGPPERDKHSRRTVGSAWGLVNLTLTLALMLSLLLLGSKASDFRLPGNQQGYTPTQPIAFSHRLHGGELKIPCLYCHHHTSKSRYAGIPASQLCMNCHRFVQATLGAVRAEEKTAAEENRVPNRIVSTELQKIYDTLGLDSDLRPTREMKPIEWTRVHNLPDFVYFDHSSHYIVGIECTRCHGPVETMERVSQFETLSMSWCVNCHREYNGRVVGDRTLRPSIDCSVCHF